MYLRSRTTGQPNLHKVDYHGKKGHGRNIFLCCRISDGKIIYIDYNRGGRGEATCYRDYDIYRNGHRYHTVRPRLLIDRVPTGSAASKLSATAGDNYPGEHGAHRQRSELGRPPHRSAPPSFFAPSQLI